MVGGGSDIGCSYELEIRQTVSKVHSCRYKSTNQFNARVKVGALAYVARFCQDNQ